MLKRNRIQETYTLRNCYRAFVKIDTMLADYALTQCERFGFTHHSMLHDYARMLLVQEFNAKKVYYIQSPGAINRIRYGQKHTEKYTPTSIGHVLKLRGFLIKGHIIPRGLRAYDEALVVAKKLKCIHFSKDATITFQLYYIPQFSNFTKNQLTNLINLYNANKELKTKFI